MNVLESVFKKEYFLINEHGKFHPTYTFDEYKWNEEHEEYEYIGLVITETAKESYEKWLVNKDTPQLSEIDELSEYVLTLEMKNIELEEQTTLNSEYALDLDTRLTMLENKQI